MESANSGDQDPKLLKSLTSQIAFPASALWSASVSGCLGPHPMHISCQATSAVQPPDWQPPLSPLGFRLQGLRVCHTIAHQNGNILAAIVHLGVGILYCQTWGQ